MVELSTVVGWISSIFVGLLGVAILWRIADGTIDLAKLISEPNGDASVSRLQLLIFTFVVALCLLFVTISTHSFPTVPNTILSLLGISASSYLVSKGIQFSNPAGLDQRDPTITIVPPSPNVRWGASQQFKAELVPASKGKVIWSVVAGPGTISVDGLYQAPPVPAQLPASAQYATVKAVSVDDPTLVDLAVITLN